MQQSYQDKALYPPQNPVSAGLRCRCPRCGEGSLFSGFLSPRPACTACGLDLAFAAESGDGPAVFVIMIVGFIVVGLVLAVELSYAPPIWVHLLLWLPLTLILGLGVLRPLKGLMIALQYRNGAAEGKLDDGDQGPA